MRIAGASATGGTAAAIRRNSLMSRFLLWITKSVYK
jgi:hypothetical protein